MSGPCAPPWRCPVPRSFAREVWRRRAAAAPHGIVALPAWLRRRRPAVFSRRRLAPLPRIISTRLTCYWAVAREAWGLQNRSRGGALAVCHQLGVLLHESKCHAPTATDRCCICLALPTCRSAACGQSLPPQVRRQVRTLLHGLLRRPTCLRVRTRPVVAAAPCMPGHFLHICRPPYFWSAVHCHQLDVSDT